MYQSLTIRNLRAITELTVDDLAQVNLFVGNNNCGKTTLLEGLFFLIGATNPQLPWNASLLRGIAALSDDLWPTFYRDMKVDRPIEIEGLLRDRQGKEVLRILPLKAGDGIPGQKVPASSSIESGNSMGFPALRGLRLEFSTSPDSEKKKVSKFWVEHGKLSIEGYEERRIRGIYLNPGTAFGDDSALRFDSLQRKKRIGEAVSALRGIDPRISDVRLTSSGTLEVDVGISGLIPAKLMGGGVTRFMSIAFAMLDSQDGIVLIDEIDTGLHHSVQKTLWKAVLSWAVKLNVQVFATTHSYECVEAFSKAITPDLFEAEAKLYRIEREGESFRSVEYTKPLLAESLDSRWEVR